MSKKKNEKEKISAFGGIKHEMAHVVWPTKPELARYTCIAIVVSAITAAAFWGIDSGILAALKAAMAAL
jgi:preprotein translocase subunit SecE